MPRATGFECSGRGKFRQQVDLGMDNVDVDVVACGPGTGMLRTDSAVSQRIASAGAQGVGVIACENTMKNARVDRSQILAGVKFVDAGVVHITKRQREGWGYVRRLPVSQCAR